MIVPIGTSSAVSGEPSYFVAIAAVSFVLTVERRRWEWSVYFAVGWGLVIGLVGWFTAQYNLAGEIVEFPFLSAILAVLIAVVAAATSAAWLEHNVINLPPARQLRRV